MDDKTRTRVIAKYKNVEGIEVLYTRPEENEDMETLLQAWDEAADRDFAQFEETLGPQIPLPLIGGPSAQIAQIQNGNPIAFDIPLDTLSLYPIFSEIERETMKNINDARDTIAQPTPQNNPMKTERLHDAARFVLQAYDSLLQALERREEERAKEDTETPLGIVEQPGEVGEPINAEPQPVLLNSPGTLQDKEPQTSDKEKRPYPVVTPDEETDNDETLLAEDEED